MITGQPRMLTTQTLAGSDSTHSSYATGLSLEAEADEKWFSRDHPKEAHCDRTRETWNSCTAAVCRACLWPAGVACYAAIVWKGRMGYDDSLDVVGIHGVDGFLGIIATGLFASKEKINAAGGDGLFFGNPGQFGVQLLTAVSVAMFSVLGPTRS